MTDQRNSEFPDIRLRNLHSSARNGILFGRNDLVESGGLNRRLDNARHEGGLKNGVLTAVEDFQKNFDRDLTLKLVPGFYGLGVLFDPAALPEDACGKVCELLALSENISAHLQDLEADRIRYLEKYAEAMEKLRQLEGTWSVKLSKFYKKSANSG